MYIVATLSAWPLTLYRDGKTIAFKSTIEECGFFEDIQFLGVFEGKSSIIVCYCWYTFKLFLTAMISDAWTFWKHYMFHHPSVYAIHKEHHKFHDPSTFAGFAIHPVEGFFTFWPILIMCVPGINLYAPLHLPFIVWFYSLNLYLHCGYTIPLLEKVLGFFLVNTSVWHNKHH